MADMRKEILRYLRDRHPASNINITPLLKEKFPQVETLPASSVLGEMANEGVVSEWGGISKLWLMFSPPRVFADLPDTDEVSTNLYEAGIRELERYEAQQQIELLNKSIIDTNVSIKKMNESILPNNFRVTKKLTYASIVVAAASAVFVLASVIINSRGTSVRQLQETNTLLQRQVQVLDSMLNDRTNLPLNPSPKGLIDSSRRR